MDKDLLKIKIAECFDGRDCKITFDPNDHYGWCSIDVGCCFYPDDLDRLRKLLYVSNIETSLSCFGPVVDITTIVIYCCYKDV